MHVHPAIVIAFVVLVGCASSGRDTPSSKAAETNQRKEQAHDLMAAGQYQGVVDALSPLAGRNSRDPQVYAMLGNAYWKLGVHDKAVENFESSLRIDYSSAETHRDFGEMLMETGRVGRALTEFELAVKYGARDPLSHYNYGLALYEFGRRDQALVEWQTAYSLDAQNAKYAEALGIGLTGRDDVKALDYFEQALELGADEPAFYNNFGLLLIRLGRYRDAESRFQSALQHDPSNREYRFNLAVARLRSGDFAAAIPLLEEIHVEGPDNPIARIYLGRAYYEESRYGEVIELLEGWLGDREASGGVPVSGIDDAYDALAMSLRASGALDRALDPIARAVALAPDNPARLNNYGVILAESGRIAEAKEQWRKVLLIDPDNAVAKQNLSAVDG